MSKIDDAYNRVTRFEDKLRATSAFTASLHEVYDPQAVSSFDYALLVLCTDLRTLCGAVEDREDYHERLHDLVTDECERRAIGGGPGWQERHEKSWSRAIELFEP